MSIIQSSNPFSNTCVDQNETIASLTAALESANKASAASNTTTGEPELKTRNLAKKNLIMKFITRIRL